MIHALCGSPATRKQLSNHVLKHVSLQEELDDIVFAWNNHRIRPVHNSRSPHGRPSIMYAVSHLYGATDHLHPVCLEKVQVCLEECVFKDFPCEEDIFNICVDLMSEHDLNLTNDVFAEVDLYITLRELINSELEPHN